LYNIVEQRTLVSTITAGVFVSSSLAPGNWHWHWQARRLALTAQSSPPSLGCPHWLLAKASSSGRRSKGVPHIPKCVALHRAIFELELELVRQVQVQVQVTRAPVHHGFPVKPIQAVSLSRMPRCRAEYTSPPRTYRSLENRRPLALPSLSPQGPCSDLGFPFTCGYWPPPSSRPGLWRQPAYFLTDFISFSRVVNLPPPAQRLLSPEVIHSPSRSLTVPTNVRLPRTQKKK
jgi:hypothetical protein